MKAHKDSAGVQEKACAALRSLAFGENRVTIAGVATGVSTAYQSARGSVAGQILTAKAKETAGKAKEAAKEALTKVTSLDEKYQVSTKLQSGLTSGFNAVSGMVRRAGGTGAPGAGGAVVGKEGL
jgi:hypothetical protein